LAHISPRCEPPRARTILTGSADRVTLKPAEKVLCPLLIVVGAGDWVTGEKPDIMPKRAALMAMAIS